MQNRQAQVQRPPDAGLTPQWGRSIGLAVAVGVAYFLAARLSLLLLTKPDGVAVFWPASGVAAGVLIALGPSARWPVAAGAMVATIVANVLGDRGSLERPGLRAVQCGRSAADGMADRALLRVWFQPRQAEPRAGTGGGSGRRDHGLRNWRDRRVLVPPQFDVIDPDHVAALVCVRRARNYYGRAADHRVRCCGTPAAAAARAWRRHRSARDAGHLERLRRFSAAGILGDRRPHCAAVSDVVVAGGPLPSGLPGGGRIHHCRDDRLDDHIRHRPFGQCQSSRSPSAFLLPRRASWRCRSAHFVLAALFAERHLHDAELMDKRHALAGGADGIAAALRKRPDRARVSHSRLPLSANQPAPDGNLRNFNRRSYRPVGPGYRPAGCRTGRTYRCDNFTDRRADHRHRGQRPATGRRQRGTCVEYLLASPQG